MYKLPGDKAIEISYGNDDNSTNMPKRVTRILDEINSPYIAQWANSLGFKHKSYTKELNKYAVIGTNVHHEIEDYLSNGWGIIKSDRYKTPGCYAFISWFNKKIEQGNRIEVLELEKSICGKYFRGTLDCLMKINNEVYLVDFKTSNNISYKYYMQLCAYRYLLSLINYPYGIDKLMIIQVNKTNPSKYKDYIIDCHTELERVELITKTFLDLVLLSINLDLIRS